MALGLRYRAQRIGRSLANRQGRRPRSSNDRVQEVAVASIGAGRENVMKLLKAIVRPDKVDAVREAVNASGVSGMTVTEVRGHGHQKGHTAIYRGQEYEVSLLPKYEISV